MLSTTESLSKKLISFMVPVMLCYVSGAIYNVHVDWERILHHCALKRVQLYLELYLNSIKLESWVLYIYFIYLYHVEENTIVGRRDLFGAIVNLFTHELLTCAKTLALWLVVLIFMGVYFITCTSSQISISIKKRFDNVELW